VAERFDEWQGELGTKWAVKARCWPWLSGQGPQNLLRCSLFARSGRGSREKCRAHLHAGTFGSAAGVMIPGGFEVAREIKECSGAGLMRLNYPSLAHLHAGPLGGAAGAVAERFDEGREEGQPGCLRSVESLSLSKTAG